MYSLQNDNLTNAQQIQQTHNIQNSIEIQANETIKHTSILNETKNYSAKNLKQLEIMYKSILESQKGNIFLNRVTILISSLTLLATILIAIYK